MKRLFFILFILIFVHSLEARNPKSYKIGILKGVSYLINNATKRKKKVRLNLSRLIPMPRAKQNQPRTKKGFLRSKDYFWKKYMKKYPHELSSKNKMRINSGFSPVVDSKWIKYHKDHKFFRGDKIEHHHLNHGMFAAPLPKGLHRGKGNSKFWHTK
jgi:hypothetical protein